MVQQMSKKSDPSILPFIATMEIQRSSMDVTEQIFGTINADISNELSRCMERALRNGIQTLPAVAVDDHGPDKLLSMLRSQYWHNADVSEMYCDWNIFVVKSRKQSTVLQLWSLWGDNNWKEQAEMDAQLAEEKRKEVAANFEQSTSVVEKDEFPNYKSMIPTLEDMQAIEEETLELRKRLAELETKRKELQWAVQELDVATQLVDMAAQPLRTIDNVTAVHETLLTHANANQALERGQKVLDAMDALKRDRDPAKNEIVVIAPLPKVAKTIKERYEQFRASENFVNSNTTLEAIKTMLVPRKSTK
jgi:hypothetical protein